VAPNSAQLLAQASAGRAAEMSVSGRRRLKRTVAKFHTPPGIHVEMIDLASIGDPQGGRAMRVCRWWRVLCNRGVLTDRQARAADMLHALHERGWTGVVRASTMAPRVQRSSGLSSGVERAIAIGRDARRATEAALDHIPEPMRSVVRHVVLQKGQSKTAGDLPQLDQPWAHAQTSTKRAVVAQALLGQGLEMLAAYFESSNAQSLVEGIA
jgi:hypothetical protein